MESEAASLVTQEKGRVDRIERDSPQIERRQRKGRKRRERKRGRMRKRRRRERSDENWLWSTTKRLRRCTQNQRK